MSGLVRRLLPVMLLFFFSTVSGSGLELFVKEADRIRSQTLILPTEATMVLFTRSVEGVKRQVVHQHRVFAQDGSFTVESKSENLSTHQEFRRNGTLVFSSQSFVKEKRLVEIRVDALRQQAHFLTMVEGEVKNDRTSNLSPEIVLQPEMSYTAVQTWLAGCHNGIALKSYSPDGSVLGDFEVRYTETNLPLSLTNKYDYPAEFAAAFPSSRSYVVADMAITGVASLIYPHHFFLIYLKVGKGLQYAGYVGEDPKKATYQYRLN